MMAAGRAAERGRRVLLLERGPTPGRKLLLTGNGRCNITNSAPLAEFLQAFGRQGDFLRPALAALSNTALREWLRMQGVETVEERKGRVFPATQDARTVLTALLRYLEAGGVKLACGQRVQALVLTAGRVAGVRIAERDYAAHRVLVATGGLSYPATGSTGDGYALARQAGHRIVPTFPAIVALETRETWPAELQGTPIKNVAISARAGDRCLAETFGEALWTHYGISGPAIYDISRVVVQALHQAREEVVLELDLRPTDSEAALDERLLYAVKKSGKQQIKTVLAQWLPERVARILLRLAEIPPTKRMNQCSKSDRRRIVRMVKWLTLHVARPRPIEEAIVTGGGVACDEVDAHTLESRLVPGLHFAGEVLDIDGPTGGFNLQAAFSTGYLVGESI